MEISLNGTLKTLPAEVTDIQQLLTQLSLDPKVIVVELNQTILPPDQYTATTLQPGDMIELIQFVGGG